MSSSSAEGRKRKEAEASGIPLEKPPSYHEHGSSSYSDASAPSSTSNSSNSSYNTSRSSSTVNNKKALTDGKGKGKGKNEPPRFATNGAVAPAYYGANTSKKHQPGCCCECCRCMDCCYVAEGRTYSACCIGCCGVTVCLSVVGVIIAVVFLGLYLRCLQTREVDMFSSTLPSNTTFTDLVIHTSNGEVIIEASAAYDEIRFDFDVEFKNKKRLTDFKNKVQNITVDAGVIEIDSTDNEDGGANVWWCPDIISIKIEVPLDAWEAGSEPDYEVHTTNGRISMTKIAGGKIELQTSNGEVVVDRVDSTKLVVSTTNGVVSLEDVTATEDLTAHTSNGEIDVSGAVVGELAEFHTSNGAIVLKDLTTVELTTHTSNGETEFDDVSADEVVCETSNGAVGGSLELRGDDKCSMEATTSNGEIHFDALSSPGSRTNDCDVTFKTSNGEIDVLLDGFNGEYTTKTSNGDVSSKGQAKSNGDIGNGSGGDEFSFTTSNGDIVVDAENA